MFLGQRARTFMGTLHGAPDYAFWYGRNEARRDLTDIRSMARETRELPAADQKR